MQNFFPAGAGQRLHGNADVPDVSLGRVGASHALRAGSLHKIRIGRGKYKFPGALIKIVMPVAVAEVGRGKQTGRVGVVHKQTMPRSVRLVAINGAEALSFGNAETADAFIQLCGQCAAFVRQSLVGKLPFRHPGGGVHGDHRHHIRGDEVAVFAAVVRGTEA